MRRPGHPIRETNERLGSDPARFVPGMDLCLAALEAGQSAATIEALDQVIDRLGEPMRAVAKTAPRLGTERNRGGRRAQPPTDDGVPE